MKVVVCGCSWSSRDVNYPDTEFGYFVADHFGWDYQNIAVVGNPNWGIRMQIDHAVKNLNADFIIINWLLGCNTWDKSLWTEYNSCFNPFDLF